VASTVRGGVGLFWGGSRGYLVGLLVVFSSIVPLGGCVGGVWPGLVLVMWCGVSGVVPPFRVGVVSHWSGLFVGGVFKDTDT